MQTIERLEEAKSKLEQYGYLNIPKHFQNVPHPPYQVSQIAQCSKQECEMEGFPLSAKDAVENTNWQKHTIYKHKRRQEDAREL